MKTKHTNKLLVLIISLMMIATLLIGMSITASAEDAGATTDYTSPAANEAKIYGANVNLGGDISMKYYVELGTGVDIRAVKLRTVFLGVEKFLTVDTDGDESDPQPVKNGDYYVFTLTGINPQCMGDPIDAELWIGEGKLTCADSSLNDYSVKQNLVNIYDKTGTDENMKQLIIDTLEYGAAAQTYRGYKTDALVTTGLSDAMTAHLNDAEKNANATIPQSSPDVSGTDGSIVKASVHFSTVNYIIIQHPVGDTTGRVSSTAIAAYDFAKKMPFEVENVFSLQYSINDYCYDAYTDTDTSAEMKALAQALYNYGLSAHIVKGDLDPSIHTGGTATCTHGKFCDVCGIEYDTTEAPDNHESEEFTYTANTNDTTTHTKKYKCCEAVANPSEAHTAEPTYTPNTDDSTKHNVTYSCCGATHSEAHSFDSTTGQCGLCKLNMAVASITSGTTVTYYETFAAAQAAWTDGTTLTLQAACTAESAITISAGTRTLDLNGFTLSTSVAGSITAIDSNGNENNESAAIIVTSGAGLTVMDSSTGGGGVLNYSGASGNAIFNNGGTLTVSRGTITSSAQYSTILNWIGSLTVTGGTVAHTNGRTCIANGDYSSTSTATVTISGGTIRGTTYGVGSYGDITISDNVNIEADCDILLYNESASLDISNAVNAEGWTIRLNNTAQVILPNGMELQDANGNKVEGTVNGYVTVSKICTHETGTVTYAPTEDGTQHTITYSCCNKTVTVDHDHTNGKCVCGVKATPSVTAPTAVSGLEYTGEELTLINAGSTTGGTLQYKVGDGEWSDKLPTATNAGTYTVYYKVVGDNNYTDTDEQSIPVTITAKDASTEATVEIGAVSTKTQKPWFLPRFLQL